ncbi:ubiquitin-like domain-containing protein [Streptomyces sp. NPDC059766]|uniref:ubiquitin-like domain-containing protein n=1 Tax=Streptomyces sp. NPDC059766 TaxID=3346940 RepID=UPI00364EDBDD
MREAREPYDAYGVYGTYEACEADEVQDSYETYESYASYEAHGAYEGYGSYEAPGPYGVHGSEDATLPRQTLRPPGAEAPTLVERVTPDRRPSRRHRLGYAGRADGRVRRLLPRALVVAVLAGGTTAFVAQDKAVELDVDGRPRTLHTFADDVTELLAQEGVRVGAHDTVAPAPGTPLAPGQEIAVRYGRPVRLTVDGRRAEVWTTAHTVQEALEQLGVRVEGAYLSAARHRRIGREGLALDVRTERAVTIMADGRARTVRTNAATVGEAVEQAGITLHGQDAISVPAGSFPRDGQTVTVLRITGGREVREEAIPFEVRRIADASLLRGTEVVERAGRPGLRRITYALRTVNGVRQKPRRERSERIREPRSQLVRVGTKPLPPSARGADHLDWRGLAACESGGRPDAVDRSGTYGGLYQFDTHTWHSLGGSGRPQDAPAAEQTRRAKRLYVRRGATPWPHCGSRLHG